MIYFSKKINTQILFIDARFYRASSRALQQKLDQICLWHQPNIAGGNELVNFHTIIDYKYHNPIILDALQNACLPSQFPIYHLN